MEKKKGTLKGETAMGKKKVTFNGETEMGKKKVTFYGETAMEKKKFTLNGETEMEKKKVMLNGETEMGKKKVTFYGETEMEKKKVMLNGETAMGKKNVTFNGETAMEKKKVTFNVETATCGMCIQSDILKKSRDTSSGPAVSFCKTCGVFLCVDCLKAHRRLVASECHTILSRDHLIGDDKTKGRVGKANVIPAVAEPSSELIADYLEFRNKVMNELNKDLKEKEHDMVVDIDKKKVKTDTFHLENCKPKENADLEKDATVHTQLFCSEFCKIHREQALQHHCELHKELICDVCKTNDHKICGSSVKLISDVAEDSDPIAATIDFVEDEISDLKAFDKKLQSDLKELKKSKDNFLFDLAAKKKEIMDWFNGMEVKAVKRMDNVFERCKNSIKCKRHDTNEAKNELNAELYFLKANLHNESSSKIDRYVKAKRAEKCCEMIKGIKDRRKLADTRFSMKVHDEFETQREGIAELYQMRVQPKGETKFNVRLAGDTRVSDITGCVIIPGGNYALADRSNARVKIVTPLMKPIASLSIPDGVFDVTCFVSSMIAVTCPSKSKICIIQTVPELEVTKEVATGSGECWGVNYGKGTFAVNCSVKNMFQVRVVNLDSQILFQVQTRDSFFSEMSINDVTNYVTISLASAYGEYTNTETDVKYVEECKQGDREDIVVMEYNYLNHLHTKGVTSDRQGNLVVCCKDTHQIYTISKTGQEVELMLAEVDGLLSPQAICYTQDKGKMLVSSENTDFIQLFEFDI